MRLNLRVYGLLITDQNELLVADELIRGNYFTKLPGGGLEPGEGTRDCLKREFMEELQLKVEVLEHVYTTDFYQPSAFRPDDQIISIYYFVKALEPIRVRISQKPFEFDEQQLSTVPATGCAESFRLIPLSSLRVEDMSLPIDQVVVKMLLQK